MSVIHRRKRNLESGQGLVEYGLILVLVAVAAIVALTLVGTEIRQEFCKILDTMTDDTPAFCANPLEIQGNPTYNPTVQRVTIRATYEGGYNEDVTVRVESSSIGSPTQMGRNGNHYEITINPLSSPCPCTFQLVASSGWSREVRIE